MQTCVCSPSSTRDSSDQEGQLFLLALELGCFSREAAIARCYGAWRGMENNYQLHLGDTTAPSESCRSPDTNVLLAIVTKWEDMGCTLGTTPAYLLLPRMHKMQKPSVSQGLYSILLLALSASTTSAYTSLGVSQDLNPQPQLLKAPVYHSATSAGGWHSGMAGGGTLVGGELPLSWTMLEGGPEPCISGRPWYCPPLSGREE